MANFVEAKLKRFHNPKMEEIQQLARSFSIEWEEALKKTPEEARTVVNSIVANRHRIAHGEDVGLTVGMIRGYYQAAVTVVSLIDQQCDS